jgi:CubicO group peptidase (beta-lactamase class C family)
MPRHGDAPRGPGRAPSAVHARLPALILPGHHHQPDTVDPMPASRTTPLRLAALLLAALLAPAAWAQPAPLDGLDAYIERGMRDWEVPGLAIAVVHGDSVVFARGYGVRELGGSDPVDEHTLFAIASTSKAFTTAALGMLVDDGRIAWDDAVTDHLPGFRLADPHVTREITLRDLVSHNSGLERHDQLWISAPFDRDEILRRARHIPRANGFRERYGYNNIMFITAGEVVGAAAGTSWDDFLEARVFAPLGMARSTSRSAVVDRRDNVSASHNRHEGRLQATPRRDYDNIGGAGAVFSSAREMAEWVRLHLNGGVVDGRHLLEEETVREMHSAQTVMPMDATFRARFPGTRSRAYGLGWYLQDYHGTPLVHHSGSINFTRTHVGMLPEHGVGVVVMANLSSSNLQQALVYRVLDAYLGQAPRDWSGHFLEASRAASERSEARERETEAARIPGTSPALALGAYAGTYTSDLYGEMPITLEDGALVLRYAPDYVADLEHWHHDTFRAVWRRAGYGSTLLSFTLDARGRITGMEASGYGRFERDND